MFGFYVVRRGTDMIVEKVINNNIVSSTDSNGDELIVMGKGIGFGVKAGFDINEDRIEKVFRIEKSDAGEKYKELLERIPLEHAKIAEDIISYAKETIPVHLNASIYLTLTDHISFAIQRYENDIRFTNALLWEIKRFYSTEFAVGCYALDLLKERLGITLEEDEAGFIALHFVNSEYGTNIADAAKFPEQVKKILDIVREEMHLSLDDNSLYYERLITHVKFLLQRVYRNEFLEQGDKELSEFVKMKYPAEFTCSEKIAGYISESTGCILSQEELMYLAIHIRHIASTTEE